MKGSKKMKVKEITYTDKIEDAVNEFLESGEVFEVKSINYNTVALANQMVVSCLILYEETVKLEGVLPDEN
jgi:hypothetical protein